MEKEPDYTNVHFIDEYPHLEEKVRLRRLARQLEVGVIVLPQVIKFPDRTGPDDSA